MCHGIPITSQSLGIESVPQLLWILGSRGSGCQVRNRSDASGTPSPGEWASAGQTASSVLGDAVPLQQAQDSQGIDPVSKAAGPGQQKPFSATPAHSPALPQAAPGPLVPLQQFCWPMVLSLTSAQLMILADGQGQPRLVLVGSCASDTVRAQSPSWLSRVDQQGHIC